MEVDEKTLEKTMQMAYLELGPEQKKAMQADLNRMVLWVKKLKEIDTKGVKPLVMLSSEINKLREDQPEQPLSQKRALNNAPHAQSPYFCVPVVKEK